MTPSILVSTNSENGFSHVRHKAITWTTDDVLFIKVFETNFIDNQYKKGKSRKYFWKCRLQNDGYFVQAPMSQARPDA